MKMIITIDNDKPFVKADLVQINEILKDSEFVAKRNSKFQFAIYCTRPVILSTEGMADYLYDLISKQFKPLNE